MSSFGQKIKQLRESMGISQKQVAEAAGIKPSSYFHIENGKTQSITIEVGKGIAKALGISFDELFEIESASDSRKKLLDLIDEQENTIQKLNKDLADKDTLIEHFRDKYKVLYFRQFSLWCYDQFNEIDELKKAVTNFQGKESQNKFEFQLKMDLESTRYLINNEKQAGVLTEFELLDVLYNNDIHVKELEGSSTDFVKELTSYWNNFIEITQAKVEQFLAWDRIERNKILRANKIGKNLIGSYKNPPSYPDSK